MSDEVIILRDPVLVEKEKGVKFKDGIKQKNESSKKSVKISECDNTVINIGDKV